MPSNVTVVTFAPATMSDLKPGAIIFVGGIKEADGTLDAPNITVGTNGVNPPM